MNGGSLEQVDEFVYLGSVFAKDGGVDKDVDRRVNAGNLIKGGLNAVVANEKFVDGSYVNSPQQSSGTNFDVWQWDKKLA